MYNCRKQQSEETPFHRKCSQDEGQDKANCGNSLNSFYATLSSELSVKILLSFALFFNRLSPVHDHVLYFLSVCLLGWLDARRRLTNKLDKQTMTLNCTFTLSFFLMVGCLDVRRQSTNKLGTCTYTLLLLGWLDARGRSILGIAWTIARNAGRLVLTIKNTEISSTAKETKITTILAWKAMTILLFNNNNNKTKITTISHVLPGMQGCLFFLGASLDPCPPP